MENWPQHPQTDAHFTLSRYLFILNLQTSFFSANKLPLPKQCWAAARKTSISQFQDYFWPITNTESKYLVSVLQKTQTPSSQPFFPTSKSSAYPHRFPPGSKTLGTRPPIAQVTSRRRSRRHTPKYFGFDFSVLCSYLATQRITRQDLHGQWTAFARGWNQVGSPLCHTHIDGFWDDRNKCFSANLRGMVLTKQVTIPVPTHKGQSSVTHVWPLTSSR